MSLKDKIESIPGYASMSSEAIMDLLNNEPYSHYRSLTSRELLLLTAKTGSLASLVDAAANTELPDQIRSLVLAVTYVLDRDNTELDISRQDIREELMPALVMAGIITQDQMNAVIAVATVNTTWAIGNLGRNLTVEDVNNARI